MHLDDKHNPIWHSDARKHLLINSRFARLLLLFLCNSDGGHGDRSTGLVVPISRSSRDFHDDIHALDNLAEWRKAHAVEVRVVDEVDEDLRRPRVLARRRERDGPSLVALRDGIVQDLVLLPLGGDRGSPRDAPLHHLREREKESGGR